MGSPCSIHRGVSWVELVCTFLFQYGFRPVFINKSMTLKVLVQRFKRVATRLSKSHRCAIHSLRSTHLSNFGFRLVTPFISLTPLNFLISSSLSSWVVPVFLQSTLTIWFQTFLIEWCVCVHVQLNANRLRCHSFREMAACLGEKNKNNTSFTNILYYS